MACGALVVALELTSPAGAASSFGPHVATNSQAAPTQGSRPHISSPAPPLTLAVISVFNYGNAPFAGSLGGSGIKDVAGLVLGGNPPAF
jgi:hypothetical protein